MTSLRGAWLVAGAGFAALLAAGCTDRACLQWTSQDGPCPSRDAALAFMGGNNACAAGKVTSVDSEGEFDGQACCYDVTEKDDELGDERPLIDCGGDSVGAGAPPNPTGASPGAFCGDGVCDPSLAETCDTCPDCACVCGDGACTVELEDCTSCPSDCPCACGDGLCVAPEEDCWTCDVDCGPCVGCYVGADGCVGCSEVFDQGTGSACPPELLCPSSAPLLDAVLSCSCSACSAECAATCTDQQPPVAMECIGCTQASCSMELASCLTDSTLPPN
jgi:hypothetical protein